MRLVPERKPVSAVQHALQPTHTLIFPHQGLVSYGSKWAQDAVGWTRNCNFTFRDVSRCHESAQTTLSSSHKRKINKSHLSLLIENPPNCVSISKPSEKRQDVSFSPARTLRCKIDMVHNVPSTKRGVHTFQRTPKQMMDPLSLHETLGNKSVMDGKAKPLFQSPSAHDFRRYFTGLPSLLAE